MRVNSCKELYEVLKNTFPHLKQSYGSNFYVVSENSHGYKVIDRGEHFHLTSKGGNKWAWNKDEVAIRLADLINRYLVGNSGVKIKLKPVGKPEYGPELSDDESPAAKYFPKEKERKMSGEDVVNKVDVCSALIGGYYVVDVEFSRGGQAYSYKVPEGRNINVGDKVLVHAGSEMKVVVVIAVKNKNCLDFSKGIKYKYVVCHIPNEIFDNYFALVESTKNFEKMYAESVQQKGVDKVRETLLSITTDEFKEGLKNV